ncbi:hypothetical protein JQ628_27300 [Bradyrhizobium lablabi]|uniref:hypothetical protein n=1 Tax=Bradyrhizobium lablabi TaxID=722472 RepID=UPI001BAD4F07|nr:hypothetical protein [Bradyrhizobium lablabi]MBR1125256.1 hypothetical protein [Bradyrhizobium lablabi]
MGLKAVSTFVFSALLLAWAGSAAADQYRADEFFGLDLSKAVLSPKRLGPPAQFAPVAVEARSDTPPPRVVRTTRVTREQVEKPRVEKTRVARPHVPARARVVRRHSNPLDAQAMDTRVQTRVQTWPCRSGGICNWK